MRILVALFSGALFGSGLLISGMTDTRKVQGWLDLFGDWDPTLAFVMAGALAPMAVAWRLSRRWKPLAAERVSVPANPELDQNLIVGSVLFGVGWALSGLCPGPAIASISYGGTGGIIFMTAMIIGMLGAPKLGAQLDRFANAS